MTQLTFDEIETPKPNFDADEETVSDVWIGSFIYTSWGYGQTNADIAQIVDVSASGKTVVAKFVRPDVSHERGSDQLRPTNETYGDEFRLHVRNSGGSPAFRGSYPFIQGDFDKGKRRGSFLPFDSVAGGSIHQTPAGMGH